MFWERGAGREQIESIRAIATTALVLFLPSLAAGFGWLQALTPLPVYYYLTVLGPERGIGTIVKGAGIAGVAALIADALPVFFFTLTVAPLGYILARAGQKKETLLAAAGRSALFLALVWLLGGWLLAMAGQGNPYQELRQSLEEGFAASMTLYEESERFSPGELQEMQMFFAGLQRQMTRLLPALIATSILCLVWLNVVAGQWLLRRKGAGLAHWPDLKTWRLPEPLVWAVILAALLLLLPGEALNGAGLNLGFVLLVLYLSQGLAVLASLMGNWAVPRFFRVLTYIVLFVQIYGIVFVAILGLADVWFDIRSRRPKADTE